MYQNNKFKSVFGREDVHMTTLSLVLLASPETPDLHVETVNTAAFCLIIRFFRHKYQLYYE